MKSRFLKKEEELAKELRASFPGLTNDFPQDPYLSALKDFDFYLPYEHIRCDAREMLDRMHEVHGAGAVALFQKLALCRLAIERLERLGRRDMPEEIEQLQLIWLERVYDDFTQQPDSYYDYSKMFWPVRKDLAICSGRATPIGGAWLIAKSRLNRHAIVDPPPSDEDQQHGLSRDGLRDRVVEFLDRIGVTDVLKKLRRAAREFAGHYDWYYEIHTVDRNIRDFNAEQMELAYGRVARLLERDPDIWGVYRESWFLDPALADISPELRFLWEVPLRHGAQLHCEGPLPAGSVAKVLATSPKRKKHFKEGRYVPRNYFYFWPRKSLIGMVKAS